MGFTNVAKLTKKEASHLRKVATEAKGHEPKTTEDEETLGKVSTWYIMYLISFVINTIVFIGLASSFLVSLAGRFPESEASVLTKYHNIMNNEIFIVDALMVIGYFTLFMDWIWSLWSFIMLQSEVAIDVLVYSNFAGNGFATFGFLVCTTISNYLLWFDFSPWYSFGLNIGALLFIMLTTQSIGIGFVYRTLKGCGNGRAWEIAKKRFSQRLRMSWVEWFSFYLPPNILQLSTYFLVFSSLFASKTYWGNNFGLDDDQMYAILLGIFVFAGTLFVEIIAGLKVEYGFLAGLFFLGLGIDQANTVVGGVSVYPISWKASIFYGVILIAASMIATPVLMKSVNKAHAKCSTCTGSECKGGCTFVRDKDYREMRLTGFLGKLHEATSEFLGLD